MLSPQENDKGIGEQNKTQSLLCLMGKSLTKIANSPYYFRFPPNITK